MAISLRVRHPAAARIIGETLNARIHELVSAEGGVHSLSDMQADLVGAVEKMRWHIEPAALAGLDFIAARREPAFNEVAHPRQGRLTLELERELLSDLARAIQSDLQQGAMRGRLDGGLDWLGRPVDAAGLSAEGERAMAFICRTIAAKGRTAALSQSERQALAGRFHDDMIGFIERELAFHAKREGEDGWSLGPPREVFETELRRRGVQPTLPMTLMLRRNLLLVLAHLLEDQEERYASDPVADVVMALKRPEAVCRDDNLLAVRVPQPSRSEEGDERPTKNLQSAPSRPTPSVSVSSGQSRAQVEDVLLTQHSCAKPSSNFDQKPAAPKPIAEPRSRAQAFLAARVKAKPATDIDTSSFKAVAEHLIAEKLAKGAWTPKTAAQHRSIAELFTRLCGMDDPMKMRQSDICFYRDLLNLLPQTYGKSARDKDLALEEILARAEDLDDDEVGLANGTINRHLTQLGSLLQHASDAGIGIGVITKAMRAAGGHVSRKSFSQSEQTILFAGPTWTGFASFGDRMLAGRQIAHDALYWGPLLGKYGALRLSEAMGLDCADVNVKDRFLTIRNNDQRTVKTESSKRDVPIHPELERLGFLDYVEAIRRQGHKIIFPELALRGSATPLQNHFYKDWVCVLDALLPDARKQRKSYHSFRRMANSEMTQRTDPVLRYQIMGHVAKDVNGRHYTDPLPLDQKAMAMQHISAVTEHLSAWPLTLHPSLSR